VYFYAVQSDEAAIELPLPEGVPGAPTMGLFTHTVAQALARGQPMTYRQLAAHVLFQYGGMSQAQATPLFTGDGLDEPVLGQRAPIHRQWPLASGAGLLLPAGSLDGLAVGARFVALADPLLASAPREGAAGTVTLRAVDVQPGHSLLTAEGEGIAAPRPGTWLRLLATPPALALRVAADTSACTGPCPWRPLLAQLQRSAVPGVALQWVAPGEQPDVRLLALPDALHYRLAADAGAAAPDSGVAWPPDVDPSTAPAALVERIASDLHGIARARNLMRLGALLPARHPVLELDIGVQWRPAGAAWRPWTPEQVPTLRPGDGVRLQVRNPGPGAADVCVLLLDAAHGVSVLYPRKAGESNRLEPQAGFTLPDLTVNGRTLGLERLLLMWTPMRTQRPPRECSALQQPALDRVRGGPADDDLQALYDAVFADQLTRAGAVPALPADMLGLRAFSFRVAR
jgi:hypothetical protein